MIILIKINIKISIIIYNMNKIIINLIKIFKINKIIKIIIKIITYHKIYIAMMTKYQTKMN